MASQVQIFEEPLAAGSRTRNFAERICRVLDNTAACPETPLRFAGAQLTGWSFWVVRSQGGFASANLRGTVGCGQQDTELRRKPGSPNLVSSPRRVNSNEE